MSTWLERNNRPLLRSKLVVRMARLLNVRMTVLAIFLSRIDSLN